MTTSQGVTQSSNNLYWKGTCCQKIFYSYHRLLFFYINQTYFMKTLKHVQSQLLERTFSFITGKCDKWVHPLLFSLTVILKCIFLSLNDLF